LCDCFRNNGTDWFANPTAQEIFLSFWGRFNIRVADGFVSVADAIFGQATCFCCNTVG